MIKPTLLKRLELRQIPKNENIIMRHKWRDLLFLHWKIDPQEIQKTLPEDLYVDTFDEKAYVGLTPFFLFDVRPVFIPSISILSDFLEVNVRTYVYDENGTPGVWFYSLDANQPIAVKLAQQIPLPYKYADIKVKKNEMTSEFQYNIKRKNTSDALSSEFKYLIEGDSFFADSESLEFFLTERYLLFTFNSSMNSLNTIRVNHMPYSLQKVNLTKWDDNLLKLNGFNLGNVQPDHIIYSPGVDVDVYNIKRGK